MWKFLSNFDESIVFVDNVYRVVRCGQRAYPQRHYCHTRRRCRPPRAPPSQIQLYKHLASFTHAVQLFDILIQKSTPFKLEHSYVSKHPFVTIPPPSTLSAFVLSFSEITSTITAELISQYIHKTHVVFFP